MKLSVIAFLIFSLSINVLFAQSFVNPDLEGVPDVAAVINLPGWESIPASDPACDATNLGFSDTPDVFDENMPNAAQFGQVGVPYSGETFVSGLYSLSINSNLLFHEGIQQEVSGFEIGDEYEISFFQSVVKQINCRDTSGAWGVYLDDNLLGISDPSVSHLEFDDVNLIWEERTIQFIATNDTYLFKFLPIDDDTDHISYEDSLGGALRMGIDKLSIVNLTDAPIEEEPSDSVIVLNPILEMPNVISANGDAFNDDFVPVKIENVEIQSVTILNRWGNVVYESNSFDFPWDGNANGNECSEGTYFWTVDYVLPNKSTETQHGFVKLCR